jgi:hypothetical protein
MLRREDPSQTNSGLKPVTKDISNSTVDFLLDGTWVGLL